MTTTKGMRKGLLVVLLAAALLSGGCCYMNTLRPLQKAKDLAGKQDYTALANVEAKCDDTCEGCNQLHLLKGDACYRQAKNNQAPLQQYSCAANELSEGIKQTKDWSNTNRTQTYLNLCESLRNWRDLTSGSQADGINDRLLNTAGQFLSVEPGNACGVYFQANSRYAKLRSCLLHPEQCPTVCTQLNNIAQSLTEGPGHAAGGDCAPQLKELAGEVALAKAAVQCQ